MIDCAFSVINANGEAISGATVKVGAATGTTGGDGRWTALGIDPASPGAIEISHPYYVTEKVSFRGDLQTAAWDNSLVRRDTASGVTLTVTLGRMDTSPTKEMTESDVEALAASSKPDPAAALLFRPPRFPGTRAYRFQWNDERTIQTAKTELLPDPPFAGLPKGWARFSSDQVKVDLPAIGRFYWLEYPQRPSSPKTVVAVFSPNLSAQQPLAALDFVVFFSPTTGAYKANYPYGLVPNTKPPDQQYMTLGKKYLIDEYFFVQQLLARRNRAIVVMPICNHGDWGPFASGEGMLRLLREVSVFLHRQCRTSQEGVAKPTSSADALAGPNQRSSPSPIVGDSFGTVPRVGRIAIGGFSTGIAVVKQLMVNWPVSLARSFWGVTDAKGESAQQAWTRAWRELWDLDGFHPTTGGWPGYLDQLAAWYGADGDRYLRLYHSSGRSPPDPMTDGHSIYKTLLSSGIRIDRSVPATPGVGWARILHGDRWTILRMDSEYVDHGPSTETPPFDDAHHTTPRIGFSHAAGVTSVGK